MAKQIPDALINYILVGSGDSRRHLQDSPILADVWIAYAENPSEPVDLIITAHNQTTGNELAAKIHELVGPRTGGHGPKIAPLRGFVNRVAYGPEGNVAGGVGPGPCLPEEV